MWVPDAQLPNDRIVSARTTVQRERLLGGTGPLLVEPGRRVEPGDLLAEVQEGGAVQVLNAAQHLGVAPERVAVLLEVAVGDHVEVGQVLAKRGGLHRRTLLSPITGTVTLLDEQGLLLLRATPQRRSVLALMQGEVIQTMPGVGVVLRGQGALLQGVWGNGREGFGLVRLLVAQPDEIAPATLINAGVRSTLLVAGATMSREGLEAARAAGVHGLIVGSLEPSLVPLARALPFPILLTEGFGAISLSPPVFGLLQSLDGREGTLTAPSGDMQTHHVPELFVPLPGTAPMAPPPGPLAVGDRVRLLHGLNLGQVGTVLESSGARLRLPSELVAPTCTVRLDNGTVHPVPYANLERLLP